MRMGIGLGVGINRSNYAQGIFNAYSARVVADGGVVESGSCVDAVSSLLQSASLLLIPSGYKGGKLYSEIPTNGNGDLTWTRGSDAFRTNASGLIQRVPWNLLQYSEQFDNAVWTKATGGTSTVTVTANYSTAPNGTNTADRIQLTRDSIGYAQVTQTITTTASQSYTFSVYLKSLSGTPTVMFGSYGGTNAQTAVLTNEWVRYTWTATSPSTSAFGMLMIWGGIASTSLSADFLAWGYQLVEGTTAQTYLPTTDRLNFPRISYMYGSCPSVLLEPQRTNLDPNSQTFSGWTLTNSGGVTVTTVSASNPYNLSTVAKVIPDAVLGQHRPFLGVNYSGAGRIWVIAKSAGYDYLSFGEAGSVAGGSIIFNLSNGTISGSAAGYTGEISSLGNGWYKCSLNMQTTGAFSRFIVVRNANSTADYTGDGTSGVLIAHKQLEVGAYDTTSILTSGATATRVADSFSRSNIYTNGLISASGGTWFVELRGNLSYNSSNGAIQLGLGNNTSGATADNIWIAPSASGRMRIWKQVAGTLTTLFTTSTDTVKIAIKWNGTTADVFVNGTKQVNATSFTPTALESLRTIVVEQPYFIQQMALFPTPLSDTDCAAITSL